MEAEELNKILKQREEYYSKLFALFEMIKALNHRELAFLTIKGYENKKAFRYMWASTLEYWKRHSQWANLLSHPMNVYCSVAVLKSNVPVFSYNLKERKLSSEYEEFNRNYIDYIEKYDFFFDVDFGSEWEEGLKDVKVLKSVLEDYKVPYFIQPSSFKGMHIIIPHYAMPDFDMDLMLKINCVINQCKVDYAPRLDNVVGDIKRLRRCSYSFSCDGSVVLPLSDWQVNNLTKIMISYEYVMKNITLKKRGLLIRDYGLPIEILKENVKNFINAHIPKQLRYNN
jgi:hypothetical protein